MNLGLLYVSCLMLLLSACGSSEIQNNQQTPVEIQKTGGSEAGNPLHPKDGDFAKMIGNVSYLDSAGCANVSQVVAQGDQGTVFQGNVDSACAFELEVKNNDHYTIKLKTQQSTELLDSTYKDGSLVDVDVKNAGVAINLGTIYLKVLTPEQGQIVKDGLKNYIRKSNDSE